MKLEYEIEFTCDQKVADEVYNSGDFSNVKRAKYTSFEFEKALCDYIKLTNSARTKGNEVLYSRFFVSVDDDTIPCVDENGWHLHDAATGLPHIESDIKLIDEIAQLQKEIEKYKWFFELSNENKQYVKEWADKIRRK